MVAIWQQSSSKRHQGALWNGWLQDAVAEQQAGSFCEAPRRLWQGTIFMLFRASTTLCGAV